MELEKIRDFNIVYRKIRKKNPQMNVLQWQNSFEFIQ